MPDDQIDTTLPLTRRELDEIGAAVLNSRCHHKRPVIVKYWGDGVLELRCSIDNKFVASVQLDGFDTARLGENLVCHHGDPTCTEPPENHNLVLRPPCHRTAGAYVVYSHGCLSIACGKCKKSVEHVSVLPART
jgi:hypothetical protein